MSIQICLIKKLFVNNRYMTEYIFNSEKRNNEVELSNAIISLFRTKKPVIICVGSDLVVGDSLGPYIGTKLLESLDDVIVYGTLKHPITAKEIKTIHEKIKEIHPASKILVIDAALGNEDEVGLIKVKNKGLKPGLGVEKDLPEIGDVSILGIVGTYSKNKNKDLLNTRFNLIYNISNTIIKATISAINTINSTEKESNILN